MVPVQQVGQEGLQESQGRDDAAQVASARRGSDKASQPRLGRMGKVLQVRVSVAAVRESERLRAVSPVQVPQQEEPAAVSAEIRRDLLRRTTETRACSPHEKEVLPMTPVSHGKPCAGNPHARFEEGASASETPRRNALLHSTYPKLENPPIAEAVFCVDFAGLGRFSKESAAKLIAEGAADYVWNADLVSRMMTFDMKSIDKAVMPETIWDGSRFVRGSSDVVVVSNLDAQVARLSYSRVGSYESWEGFIYEARRFIKGALSSRKADPIVKRIGVRYINRILLPEGKCAVSDILYSVPPDPRGIENISSSDFFYKDTSFFADFNLSATTIKATQRSEDGKLMIVVDADVFDIPDMEYSKIEWESLLGRIRELKNALFFGAISEKYLSERKIK